MNNNIKDAKISVILKIFKIDTTLSSLLNFNENKGIFITKSRGRITEIAIKNLKSESIENCWYLSISGNDATKIASTGVGRPINAVVCLVSILNFANRIAEKIGNKKARIAGNKFGSFISDWKKEMVWL